VETQRPKERLEEKFDHILEIRVDNARTRKIMEFPEAKVELMNPYEAFCNFFSEMNGREMTKEENKEILDVIERAREAGEK
jgi:exonuclease SbcD